MINVFEAVKSWVTIRQVVELLNLVIIKGKIACPFHQDKTPSLHIYEDTNSFHCFGCGASGDIIQFVALYKGISLLEAAKYLAQMFNVPIDNQGDKPMKKENKTKDYIEQCIIDVNKTNYFESRGLTKETIKRHLLGYDPSKNMVITPYSSKKDYYIGRRIDIKQFDKPKVEDAGPEPLFYEEALYNKKREAIFVAESPICAISIYQSEGIAVSPCGTGYKKLIDAVKRKKPVAPLIIALDNDEPGEQASQGLCNELFELGVKFIKYNIADEFKDPNELLVKDAERLKTNIQKAQAEAIIKTRTDKESFSAYELQNLKLEPPEWLIDKVLPTGLAIIAAPSKMGKSWMMLQICIAITTRDTFLGIKTNQYDCFYYALEDSKIRLQDRINKVLQGKSPPESFYLAIKVEPLDNGLLEQVNEELIKHPNIKLVIIDTLQMIRGRTMKNETSYASDYREMSRIKEFADKHKICILLVHHLRKMSDNDDVFNMISGSNGIMGACDTIFTIKKKKRNDDTAMLSMTGRDILQTEMVVKFNPDNYCWESVGSSEEQERKAVEKEYNDNPIIKTIKGLLDKHPYGWEGSAGNILKLSNDVLGYPVAETTIAVGKITSKYESRLYADGIDHKVKRSGSARLHIFTKCDKRIKQMEVKDE